MSGEDIRSRFPRSLDFLALASRMDPQGKFRNPFLDAWMD